MRGMSSIMAQRVDLPEAGLRHQDQSVIGGPSPDRGIFSSSSVVEGMAEHGSMRQDARMMFFLTRNLRDRGACRRIGAVLEPRNAPAPPSQDLV